MKKYLMTLLVICGMFLIGVQAHALSITPSNTALIIATGQDMAGNQNSTSKILEYIDAQGLVGTATELYKQDVGGAESGVLANSYNAALSESGGVITFTGGSYIGDPQFMLVKDGNNDPWWYLFNLTNVWNGTETIELSGFWPNNGSISHVSLYGTSTTSVPEPATLILLGLGLLGIAGIRRKK